MAELHKIVATLKDALETQPRQVRNSDRMPPAAVATPASVAQRQQLASQFARELESVAGRFLGTLTPAEAIAKMVDVAHERNARLVAIGEGVEVDSSAIETALFTAGVSVMHPSPIADAQTRIALRERLARCDLGIAEAHFAIASTGTLGVFSSARRSSSLTLLPPASLILVHIDRVVPDLAAALARIDRNTIARDRLTLITGPSRTADIEKRIVLGVHGPKSLDVIVVWPHD